MSIFTLIILGSGIACIVAMIIMPKRSTSSVAKSDVKKPVIDREKVGK